MSTFEKKRARVALITTVAMAFGVGLATPALARTESQDVPPVAAVEAWQPSAGASLDAAAIADAADDFSPAALGSIATLASAASADSVNPISAIGGDVGIANGSLLEVGSSEATLTSVDGVEIGIRAVPLGFEGQSTLVDGVVVTNDVAPSTDLVTRATESGVQLMAVLADETAPDRVVFDLDLPEGATLSESADGSIAVTLPTETIVFDPVESAQFDAQVAAIVGDAESLDVVTDEQWEQLDKLTPVSGELRIEQETIAIIDAPWAVDANGSHLGTSYEIDGSTLTQIIETDAGTSYPVVADPSASFWVKAAKCVGQLGLMTLAVAKAASMVVKLVKYVSGLKATSKVAKAWKQIVGSGSTVNGFKKLAKSLGKLLKKLATDGWSAMKQHATTTAVLTASFTMLTLAGDAIATIIGIDQCVDLALGRY